ncbi:hypothetical protein ACJJTC_013113 [Scirpophaga incertulas]
MGSIASVLQWHCQTCGQINPTESVKCLKCGTKRVSGHDSERSKAFITGDSSSEYSSRTGKSDGTTPGSEAIVIPTENKFNSGWSCVGSAPDATRAWRCACGLRNVSVAWRCAACDALAPHAPVYRFSDDEDQASGMTDKDKSAQDNTMIRSNTLAVPSYKPSSSYSDGRRLNLDLQSLRLSPTQLTDQAHGVTRSLSHGSVINSQQKWWKLDETKGTINRPTSLMVSERYGYNTQGNPRESFLRSLHTVTRRPKKCNESKSNWELNYVKEYQREQSRALHLKKWACSKCTLENSGIRTHCEACLSPRVSPLARIPNSRGLSVTTLGRHETLSGREGAASLPSTGGVMITVPDWPQTGSTTLGGAFRKSISAQNSPEIRPSYRRSFSEQTNAERPIGKVISSRRSLNEYQRSLASYCGSLTRPEEKKDLFNKKIEENSVELIDKECSWDTNAEGVIYALPNKGKYKDLNLQLQVNNNGTKYSYVSVQDTKNVMSNSQNEALYSNDIGEGDYARIDELLGAENCISPVTETVGASNLRTSHIGIQVSNEPVFNILPSVGKVSQPREPTKVPLIIQQQPPRENRMWQCNECWFAYNAWWARACDVCRSGRPPHAPVTLATRDAVPRHRANAPSEASGSKSSESNRNEPKKLTVPIASLDHDLNSDELLFAVESNPGPPPTATAATWSCSRCTLVNDGDAAACAACAGSKPQPHNYWSCSSCTLRNPLSANLCLACKTPPVPKHGVASSSTENHAVTGRSPSPRRNTRHTPALPRRKHKTPPLEPKRESEWACSECTYMNAIKSLSCEMCQSPKTRLLPAAPDQPSLDDDDSPEGSDGERHESTPMEILRLREESHAWTQWQEVLAQCAASGESYVDESFPACSRSLYYSGGGGGGNTESGAAARWLRPAHIHVDADHRLPWVVFRDPRPSDISQGVLGNCWLLSALAVLAERSSLVRGVVVRGEPSVGAYQLRLCKDGRWLTVTVDDLLPANKKGHLVYSQAKRKQLWVPLIEKAVAKLHGCYEALVSGRAIEGLCTLTGAPCESVSLQAGGTGGGSGGGAPLEQLDRDLVWAQLLSSRQACFLMGASCGGGNMKVDEDEYQRLGLRPRHAYSVLDVVEVAGPTRLLRLRNPWGHYTWRGAWAHGCPRWTEEARRAVQSHTGSTDADRDQGVFWISFDDVLKYFDCIDICKVRVGWHEVRLAGILPPMSSTRHLTCLLLTATQPTEVDFTLFQEGQRNSAKSQRSQLDLCVVVFRTKSGPNAQVGKLVAHSKRQVRGFVGCHKMLEKGFYLVVCLAFNHWHTGLELADSSAWPRHVLAAHSSKPLAVERPSLHPHILADAIIGLTLARGQRHEGRQGMTAYYLTKGWAGLVVMVENRHTDKWIHVKCDCQESYNVVSTRGELKTIDSVPPLHRQVIIVLTQLEGSGGFSIAHRLTHRLAGGARLQDWAPHAEGEPRHKPPLARRLYGLHAPRLIT